MAEKDWIALAGAIFSRQMDEDVDAVPDEDSFMQLIRSGRKLSAAERALLLTSPLARDRYRFARYRLQRAAEREWQTAGWSEPASALLAASGSTAFEVVEGLNFKVQIYKDSLQNWLLTLLVKPECLEWVRQNPGHEVQLQDSGGAVWLRARPDAAGEVTVDWPFEDFQPRDRLNRYTLELVPRLPTA